MVYNLCFRLRNLTYYYRNVEVPSDQIFTLILVICLQFATRVLSILHTTFTPHYETKVAHYQFSLSRTPPRIMTTSLIMVLPPVFVTSFLHEAIVIITTIFEIMILISRFPNLRKNFLREVSSTEVLFYGTVFLMSPMKLKLLNRFILSKG